MPAVLLLVLFLHPVQNVAAPKSKTLVTVNKQAITQGDLELLFLYLKVPKEKQPELNKRFLEKLIDAELIRQFLGKRKVYFDHDHVKSQIEHFRLKIKKDGQDPDQVFASLGFDQEKLKKKVTHEIQWHNYILKKASPVFLRQYYSDHHEKFDGTTVQAKQIFFQNKDKNETAGLIQKLEKIKKEIESGSISFSNAARKYSQAPSASKGGDIGTFSYRGTMPVELTEIIFQVSPGEISAPVETQFGLHLYTVTKKTPGDLSLEDVRKPVIQHYSTEVREQTVKNLRSKAKIRYSNQ